MTKVQNLIAAFGRSLSVVKKNSLFATTYAFGAGEPEIQVHDNQPKIRSRNDILQTTPSVKGTEGASGCARAGRVTRAIPRSSPRRVDDSPFSWYSSSTVTMNSAVSGARVVVPGLLQ